MKKCLCSGFFDLFLWISDFILLVFPEELWKLYSYQENLYCFTHLHSDLSGDTKEKSATPEKTEMATLLVIF